MRYVTLCPTAAAACGTSHCVQQLLQHAVRHIVSNSCCSMRYVTLCPTAAAACGTSHCVQQLLQHAVFHIVSNSFCPVCHIVSNSCSSMRYVTLSSIVVTVNIRTVPLMRNVMCVSVCLYWIGNMMLGSRSPIAEDVRHLGYDIVQTGKDLSMFRRIEKSSLSRSITQRRSSLLLFLCFLYSTMKVTESFETSVYTYISQSKRINFPES
jgi:hypothetical protein